MKRAVAALVVAIPVAWIATGFADHSGWSTNDLAMCLLAPGLALALNVRLPLGHPTSWLGGLAPVAFTALAINLLYYAGVVYSVLTIIFALGKKYGPKLRANERRDLSRYLR